MKTPTDLPNELAPVAGRLETALELHHDTGLAASAAARLVGTETTTARTVLTWMVSHQVAHTVGDGACTRYHPGGAR